MRAKPIEGKGFHSPDLILYGIHRGSRYSAEFGSATRAYSAPLNPLAQNLNEN